MPSTFPERDPDQMAMPSGKPLRGAAAESAQRARIRREEEARLAASNRPLALLMLKLAGGPDGARAKLGRDDALALIHAAGLDAERIGGNWTATEPQQRQVSVAGPHAVDPQLDADALLTPDEWRLPFRQLNERRAQLARQAEQQRQAAREAARATMPSGFPDSGLPVAESGQEIYREKTGQLGVRVANGQRSVEYKSWAELHQADPLARRYLASNGPQAPVPDSPPSVTECEHTGPGPFCTACGRPVPAQVP